MLRIGLTFFCLLISSMALSQNETSIPVGSTKVHCTYGDSAPISEKSKHPFQGTLEFDVPAYSSNFTPITKDFISPNGTTVNLKITRWFPLMKFSGSRDISTYRVQITYLAPGTKYENPQFDAILLSATNISSVREDLDIVVACGAFD